MVSIIRTTGRTFNIFVTRDEMFALQGNLTLDELKELIEAGNTAIANATKSKED